MVAGGGSDNQINYRKKHLKLHESRTFRLFKSLRKQVPEQQQTTMPCKSKNHILDASFPNTFYK